MLTIGIFILSALLTSIIIDMHPIIINIVGGVFTFLIINVIITYIFTDQKDEDNDENE